LIGLAIVSFIVVWLEPKKWRSMKNSVHKSIIISIASLTAVSGIFSIFNNDIYLDGEWANAQWLGQDIVTVFVALPLLIISWRKGSRTNNDKWVILNAGVLLYFAYTYSFYVFVAQLTNLYFSQVPIFGLSVVGFVLCCVRLFGREYSIELPGKVLRAVIIVYLVVIALMLAFIWLSDIFAHLSDPYHRSETPNGEPPLVIYSLDLGIIIPLMIASGTLLYQRTNWGYILGGIILTKTSLLGFALMAMSVSMYVQQLNPDQFLILLWSIIGVVGTLLTVSYLKTSKIVYLDPTVDLR
jgi:hypothetical protein